MQWEPRGRLLDRHAVFTTFFRDTPQTCGLKSASATVDLVTHTASWTMDSSGYTVSYDAGSLAVGTHDVVLSMSEDDGHGSEGRPSGSMHWTVTVDCTGVASRMGPSGTTADARPTMEVRFSKTIGCTTSGARMLIDATPVSASVTDAGAEWIVTYTPPSVFLPGTHTVSVDLQGEAAPTSAAWSFTVMPTQGQAYTYTAVLPGMSEAATIDRVDVGDHCIPPVLCIDTNPLTLPVPVSVSYTLATTGAAASTNPFVVQHQGEIALPGAGPISSVTLFPGGFDYYAPEGSLTVAGSVTYDILGFRGIIPLNFSL